jgi:hypothetical protein
MLHERTVETGMLELIKRLSGDSALQDFLLVGGTALSLQIGHRKSVDIDLFTNQGFDAKVIAKHVEKVYAPSKISSVHNGVFSFVNGVKVDLVAHGYPWIGESNEVNGVRMASLNDIAAMKLHAIVNSGSRIKDFTDIYYLLEKRTLNQMVEFYTSKYPKGVSEQAKYALMYHEDVKKQHNLFLMRPNVGWDDMKERFRQALIQPNKFFAPDMRIRKLDAKEFFIQRKGKGKRL